MHAEPTVFVVDDDDLARKSVCALVQSMGMHAESFASAEEFLGKYSEDRPGCLVADFRMLGMSGVELQENLARRGLLAKLQANSTADLIRLATQAETDD